MSGTLGEGCESVGAKLGLKEKNHTHTYTGVQVLNHFLQCCFCFAAS